VNALEMVELGEMRGNMDNAQMLIIIGSILIPLFTGFGYVIKRLSSIETKLSKLEGAFEERGRWESRMVK